MRGEWGSTSPRSSGFPSTFRVASAPSSNGWRGNRAFWNATDVTGGATLLLKVKCANTEGLEDLISTMRSELGVERTETMVVLSTAAERVALPVSPGDAAKSRRRGPAQRAGVNRS